MSSYCVAAQQQIETTKTVRMNGSFVLMERRAGAWWNVAVRPAFQ